VKTFNSCHWEKREASERKEPLVGALINQEGVGVASSWEVCKPALCTSSPLQTKRFKEVHCTLIRIWKGRIIDQGPNLFSHGPPENFTPPFGAFHIGPFALAANSRRRSVNKLTATHSSFQTDEKLVLISSCQPNRLSRELRSRQATVDEVGL
jgi:hypothetical protein